MNAPSFRRRIAGRVVPAPAEVPHRLIALREPGGHPHEAEWLWRQWHSAFNDERASEPRATVRCRQRSDKILGEVRVVGGRLVLGVGHRRRGFRSFIVLMTSHLDDEVARVASDPPPERLCARHPEDGWAIQRSEILRRAGDRVEGKRFKVAV